MKIEDYLKDELERLSNINDVLYEKINNEQSIYNEPEQIIDNVKAMCEIANTICNLRALK